MAFFSVCGKIIHIRVNQPRMVIHSMISLELWYGRLGIMIRNDSVEKASFSLCGSCGNAG